MIFLVVCLVMLNGQSVPKLYKEKILNDGISNFGDPIEWQKEERKDRKID